LTPDHVTDVPTTNTATANTVTLTHAERLDAVRSAVASQRLEGLEPDPEVVAELERAAREGTSFDAVVDAYLARVRAGMGEGGQ
jgi:hypothetical protein